MTVAPVAILVRRRADFPAALFAGGVAAQLLLALTLGWHPANHRYLVVSACLGWAGVSLLTVPQRRRWASLAMAVLLAICAVLVPFSVVRSPERLALGFRDRDALLSGFARQMIARAKTWKQNGELPVVLTAGQAPVFHLYEQLRPDLISIPELSEQARERGANAVLAVDLDYEVLGANSGMLMVAASGTAVVV
jgi:hypothetical protein